MYPHSYPTHKLALQNLERERERVREAMRILILMVVVVAAAARVVAHDYVDALSKSILFFEGQRSGKLPANQRLTWRKDSALLDGSDHNVDLTGGYYDAGDNVKYNFPMAFSTTMLAWSVVEFGSTMGSDLEHALDAIRWSTDYLLKATSIPDVVFAQVGDANADHNCWERPEDMDTPRPSFAVTKTAPGSEVSAEIAAALAASSIAFKSSDRAYSNLLLERATTVFDFANKYRGSYNDSIGHWVCPFYCDFGGYEDELLWGAAWLHKATKLPFYSNYVIQNIRDFEGYGVAEFGWDAKHAGVNVLISKDILLDSPFPKADEFVCSILPESPTRIATYSPGGLLFKPGMCNFQHTTALSFLLLTYGRYLSYVNRVIHCGDVAVNSSRLIRLAKSQVDYILGNNPMNMSYMVGYGLKFPQRIHHRGSSMPSIVKHQQHIQCKEGTPYFLSKSPNPNLLMGALVGGPDKNDWFADDRVDATQSEPTTYVNAPFVGLLAYFKNRALKSH